MSIMEIKGYLVVKGSKKTTGIWNIQTVEYEVGKWENSESLESKLWI